ncbi:MAG: cation:proton antiporter subunit C [Bacteroidales bacterium]|nr:cation:proton antiporter subunit C [Bacteroidales bacterium]
MIVYSLCFVLFMVGLYGVVTRRNMIKIVIGLAIMEISIFMFLVLIGYIQGAEAPIITGHETAVQFVDPLPQAMVLTAIVIGLATNAMLLAIAIRIYKNYGTFDIRKVNELKG